MSVKFQKEKKKKKMKNNNNETYKCAFPWPFTSREKGYYLCKVKNLDRRHYKNIVRDVLFFMDEGQRPCENIEKCVDTPAMFDRHSLKHFFITGNDKMEVDYKQLEKRFSAKFVR